jgi:two-component system alkaline phosphatase synthesis response regulator PhoP
VEFKGANAVVTTILVVDDKASVRKVVRDYLAEEGFQVVTAENGRDALYVARHEKPDLILLDIMMPEMGGYEFLRAYRKERNTPVILLTARLEESDKVLGLELGADDYVTKPFGMRELIARIRAVLRRVAPEVAQPEVLRAGDLRLDLSAHTLHRDDRLVRLTPSEFELLATLMAAPGRAFTRLELLERLQGIAIEGVEHTVNTHIHNLRAKIEPDPGQPRYIEAVFGVGYRFRGE